MHVHLSSHFTSYTAKKPLVEAAGSTVGEVMGDLDRRFPGLRFRIIDEQDRIRPHVCVYVNVTLAKSLATSVRPDDEMHVLGALSGG